MSAARALMRPYAGRADVQRLVDFLVVCRAAEPRGDYPHIGDLLWSSRDPALDPERNVLLWETADRRDRNLIGFTKVAPPSVLWIIRPDWKITNLPRRGFDWGMTRLQEIAVQRGEPLRVEAQARDDNGEKIAFLEREGFIRSDRYSVELVRSLDGPSQPPQLPPDFRMRSGPEAHEVDDYVSMHRDAWGPRSTYSAAVHEHMAATRGTGAS